MKSRHPSAASTSTCAGAAASFAAWAASPGRSSVFDGMHAQYDPEPCFGQRSRAVLAGRAAADHDDVVVAHPRSRRRQSRHLRSLGSSVEPTLLIPAPGGGNAATCALWAAPSSLRCSQRELLTRLLAD